MVSLLLVLLGGAVVSVVVWIQGRGDQSDVGGQDAMSVVFFRAKEAGGNVKGGKDRDRETEKEREREARRKRDEQRGADHR